MYQNITTLIKNTTFISNTYPDFLISVPQHVLLLEGPVLFIGAQTTKVNRAHKGHGLIDSSNAIIHFHNYIEIFNCSGFEIFQNILFLILKQPVRLNIHHNSFLFFADDHAASVCEFQYLDDQNLDSLFAKKVKLQYSIIFKANKWITLSKIILKITHCNWIVGSAFNVTIPVEVNERFITFVNNSIMPQS